MAWQWYPLLGVIVTFAVGGVLSLRRPVVFRRQDLSAEMGKL